MARAQELLYAVVGAGDLAVEKMRANDPTATRELYDDFVKRGRAISTKVRSSAPTKQAVAQTKIARSQVKAAGTSVRKAVRAGAKATQSAASRAAKAS